MPKLDELSREAFSLQEKKISTIIIVFVSFSVIGGYLAIKTGDIPPNIATLLGSMALIIGGVNAVDSWASKGNNYPEGWKGGNYETNSNQGPPI